MANSQGFGIPRPVKPRVDKTKKRVEGQRMPNLDFDRRVEMWQAGLLPLRLPEGVEARSLTAAEIEWLDRAAAAEYIASEKQGQEALFYTSPPPDFRLEAADWYLRPDDRWNHDPVPLQQMIQRFPIELFQLSASGQTPAFYPDRTPDYTDAQEAVMRSIFRETVRIGWSLPQYKWFVMEQLRKTTARVTQNDAVQLLAQLQQMDSEPED
ncbi:hypothetical protein [Myxacorys almedinensis]|uniref:Uncharacterized protein n=1 Tax=Myxacorys almedinensis A TaxID=2690445 RepID=A0A8J7Z626_9CYAN|nr:hypothetical protein [Myxacorys almedinensis]NDJ18566.1 hypothetical protein [Myxacorys almedinensis A]